jgi:beta-phosphoglucomutase-like phosphatase (HAD superfamily)
MSQLPGFGPGASEALHTFTEITRGGNGLFRIGKDGVKNILTPADNKAEFIIFEDKTLVFVKSQLGYPAIYPLREPVFNSPAKAVLTDLDGTSVHSEKFWIWIIQETTASLLDNPRFELEDEDEPQVSGHSVSEHLQHCVRKYCPDKTLEEARRKYFEIAHHEMKEIVEGRGRKDAFVPNPGLKDFLLTLKSNKIKIGLVTSGLYEKAWPEILSAFRTLNLGDPLDFYDAIITAGQTLRKGQTGTMGELAPKPHPWLYAETARIGLEIPVEQSHHVIGLEDSSAGVLSIRLAGFTALGISGGNIERSGIKPLLSGYYDSLADTLPFILGK